MPSNAVGSSRRFSKGRAARGFAFVDVLVATVVIVIAILGHVASTVAHHRLSHDERSRSSVLRTVGHFIERLRGEEDWATLYARLRIQQSLAVGDKTLPGLASGLGTFPLKTYVPGFAAPTGLTVLVEVPSGSDAVTDLPVLREDLDLPEYQLPSDLDGDGAIDSVAHDADYLFLPIKATFRWERPGVGGAQQLSVVTWLRGER